MERNTTSDAVPIDPRSFAKPGIGEMTMEEVVETFLDQEKRRHKEAKDDENQQEAVVGLRITPNGLISVLRTISRQLGISRSMLTKCLSHHVAYWLDNAPQLSELKTSFLETYQEAIRQGYPDLCDSMDEVHYIFAGTSVKPTTFRTIAWVQNKLSDLSPLMGIPTGAVFALGLCWSVRTSSNELYQNMIDKYMTPELDKFRYHMEERLNQILSFKDTLKRRASRI